MDSFVDTFTENEQILMGVYGKFHRHFRRYFRGWFHGDFRKFEKNDYSVDTFVDSFELCPNWVISTQIQDAEY